MALFDEFPPQNICTVSEMEDIWLKQQNPENVTGSGTVAVCIQRVTNFT